MRLDLWLWAVRVFKTRVLASAAIKAGQVKVNGLPAKQARAVHPGETVVARVGPLTRTVRALGAPQSRVGAKLVPQFAEDLTPPEEYAKRSDPNFIPPLRRPKGAGRPTKRERRQIDDLGTEEN